MLNHTSQFEKYLVYLLVLIVPVSVLSAFANAYVTPKTAVLFYLLGAVLIVKAVRNIALNRMVFSASKLDLPVALLAIAYIASSLIQSPNIMEAYFVPGTATIVIAGAALFYVINQMSPADKTILQYVLFASGVLVALVVLFAATGVFRGIQALELLQSPAFSTLGGPLPSLIYLAAIAPFGILILIKDSDMVKKVFAGVSLTIVTLAAVINLINVMPGSVNSPQMPGFNTSWYVAIDSLKESPLLGVGPGNYLTAFNRFRPISYNNTDLWSVRFTSGQGFVFTTITETGMIGAAAIIVVVYYILRMLQDKLKTGKNSLLSQDNVAWLPLLVITASLIVFPATPTLIIAFFVLMALVSQSNQINLGLPALYNGASIPFAARMPVLAATVPVVLLVAFLGYHATNVFAADLSYKKALDYITLNDGGQAYDTLQKAINKNPYVDRYRITYAQINLALADSLAQNEDITDQDRETIAQLIQQAIREGKMAVALNPQRAGNWEVLASIYRAIIPLAEGADVFAAETYAQAVFYDQLNPNTRIALGGIYYAAGAYDDAVDIFRLAVRTKPDLANAHYNLAIAYREKGDIERAINAMSQVLGLVQRDTDDYTVASQVLEDLQNRRASALPESTNLTPPPTGDEPGLEPPLELPGDAAPPTGGQQQTGAAVDEEAEKVEATNSPSPGANP